MGQLTPPPGGVRPLPIDPPTHDDATSDCVGNLPRCMPRSLEVSNPAGPSPGRPLQVLKVTCTGGCMSDQVCPGRLIAPPPHLHPISTPSPPQLHPISTPSPPHLQPISTPSAPGGYGATAGHRHQRASCLDPDTPQFGPRRNVGQLPGELPPPPLHTLLEPHCHHNHPPTNGAQKNRRNGERR